jgi:hypothetical protein
LNETQKLELLQNFDEFEELTGGFVELDSIVGREITQEIVYICATLFETKLRIFRQLINKEESGLLPKIERFWGN